MDKGLHHGRHYWHKSRCKIKARTLLLSLIFLTVFTAGGTIAYLTVKADPVTNKFTPSKVACEVTEDFDGMTKSQVNVTNTGDTDAYIRVKLVTYRVNDEEQHIGGNAEIPAFTPGANWVKYGDCYYYTLPVAPGQKPSASLIESIQLTNSYNDIDGGKQVIEVMAEAIQSSPSEAVAQAWGVAISEGSVTAYSEN